MAISISGLSSSPLFTAQFDNLKITSDDAFVIVTVTVGGKQIFSQSLYTFNSVVMLRNINSLIEVYMRTYHKIIATATIRLTCDSDDDLVVSQILIFCETVLSSSDTLSFLKTNFLTDSTSARVSSDSFICLSAVTMPSEEPKATFSITYARSGSIYTYTTYATLSYTSSQYNSVSLVKPISSLLPSSNATLLSVTVTLGSRTLTYFIDDTLSGIRLAFFNRFNAPELVALPAVTTDKITVDRTLAGLGASVQFYDRSVTSLFTSEASCLPYAMRLSLQQLLSSTFVGFIADWNDIEDGDFYSLPEILITDFTFEPQNGDDELNTLKLTWRFSNTRIQANATVANTTVSSGTSGSSETNDRIFTSQFTSQFS